MMLALATVYDWEIEQMDVVTAFLNLKVDGDVYMALPQGIEVDKPQVCKLRKSLYGLKQTPCLWYEHIDHFLRSLGLQQCEYDLNVYLSASPTLTNQTDPPLAIRNSKRSDPKAMLPIGYTVSDFAGDPDDRKSTSGYVFMLAGGTITWCARKQPLVAFSMVEAKNIGASDVVKEAIWICSLYAHILYGKILYKQTKQYPHCLCSDNDSKATEPQKIFVDNQGAIQIAKNPKFHERTKHISVHFHFVREAWKRNAIKTTYLPKSNMLTDIMTKNLLQDTNWKHAHGLGLVSRDSGEVSNQPRIKYLK